MPLRAVADGADKYRGGRGALEAAAAHRDRSHRFPVIQPNSGRRDYLRSSCDGKSNPTVPTLDADVI